MGKFDKVLAQRVVEQFEKADAEFEKKIEEIDKSGGFMHRYEQVSFAASYYRGQMKSIINLLK